MRFAFSSLSLLVALASHASTGPVPHQELLGAYRLSAARCGAREIPTSDFVTHLQVERRELVFTTDQEAQVNLVRNGQIIAETIRCRTVQNARLEPDPPSPSLLALARTENRTLCTDRAGETVSEHSSVTEAKEAGVLAYTLHSQSLRLIYLNAAKAPCPDTGDGLELNFERTQPGDTL